MGRARSVCTTSVVALALVVCTGAAGGAARAGWSVAGVGVVGGPVAADGHVLVLTQGPGAATYLESRDARTGRLQWRVRQGFSQITAGVAVAPLASGGVALALAPTTTEADGPVRLEGIALATGRALWRSPTLFVSDAPTACPAPLGAKAFCLTASVTSNSPVALVAYAPRTGKQVGGIYDIERNLGPGLYEAVAQRPTAVQVSAPKKALWAKPFATLFGAGYDPNEGWFFEHLGALDVGSIGKVSGATVRLGSSETVGITGRTGTRRWLDHGEFGCGGTTLPTPFLCLLTGTATVRKGAGLKVSRDATLTYAGFDAATGHITWRRPAGGLTAALDETQTIANDHALLTTTRAGKPEVLDLRNGHATAPGSRVFWCPKENTFHVSPGTSGVRVGAGLFVRCAASGKQLADPGPGLDGAAATSAVGVTVDGLFIWAGPAGLHAAATH